VNFIVSLDGDLLVSADPNHGMLGQMKAITYITNQLGKLVLAGHKLAITHGNAPQVGFMLLRGEAARHVVHPLPLDICGADTQGATGYMLQQSLRNWLDHQQDDTGVVALVTQVIVGEPTQTGAPRTKGIGPYFEHSRAQALEKSRGWELGMISGQGFQRIVPCLTPKRIIEANAIRYLFDHGMIVICSGGGGIPVMLDDANNIIGVEGVVDKAYTAFLLLSELKAKMVIFVSPWERIVNAFDFALENGLHRISLSDLDGLIERRPVIEDTMWHKIIASRNYLKNGGKSVLIVPPDQLGLVPDQCKGIKLVANHVC
jgi:carbamate kinase